MARTVGWIAQWNEMIEDPSNASAGRAKFMSALRAVISPSSHRIRQSGSQIRSFVTTSVVYFALSCHLSWIFRGLTSPPSAGST